jgi:hypothetical protein
MRATGFIQHQVPLLITPWTLRRARHFDRGKSRPLESKSHTLIETFLEDLMAENETTYHAVEKDGVVTAIWEMQGRKHLRTIDPRSEEGRRILGSYTVDDAAETAHAEPATQTAQQGE